MLPLLPHVMDYEKILRSIQALALTLSALCAGCQSMGRIDEHASVRSPRVLTGLRPVAGLNLSAFTGDPTQDLWARLGQGFTLLDNNGSNLRIEQQRDWFVSNPSFLGGASSRASRYIHFIAQRLDERKMPPELALLPIIESAYNPMANSNRDAAGLWQFIPSTGRDFNLHQTGWYDGRRDILASSNAAMDYLTRLHDRFSGDWLLALAAYNAGEGTVSRAIAWNQQRGLPIDYWHLTLPQETQGYVPRLLALSQLVREPQAYGIKLSPVANVPYFEVVELSHPVDLAKVAVDAGIEEAELVGLNPAFLKKVTLDGPAHLLVPRARAQTLSASLSKMYDESLAIQPEPQKQMDQPVAMVQTKPSMLLEKRRTVASKTPRPDKLNASKAGVAVVVYVLRQTP
ncbi:transglycosylase SLT domain-containing protein [Pseudomonas sp. 5C2]|uniref:lytic transglycosylase domain-containing protein n=1 Tax=Pseudomonas sp. 5C2 TaxID=3048588 RepID=UPI003A0FD2CE